MVKWSQQLKGVAGILPFVRGYMDLKGNKKNNILIPFECRKFHQKLAAQSIPKYASLEVCQNSMPLAPQIELLEF